MKPVKIDLQHDNNRSGDDVELLYLTIRCPLSEAIRAVLAPKLQMMSDQVMSRNA